MTLAEIIINYRQEEKLSQREFATKCGLSNAAISNIEKGKVNPSTGKQTVTSIETLMKIASGMGISLDALFEKMDNNIPLRIDFGNYRQKFHPSVVEMLDRRINGLQEETNLNDLPKTEEARILSKGIDQLPEEQRKQAVAMFELMFSKYINLKGEGEK